MATHGLLVVLYHAFQIMQTSGLAIREFPGTLAYSDADTFCRSQGMRLPVLTSPYSQSLALGALGPSPESEYWIGLDYITGDFRWADNSPLCWKNWFVSSANEPNNLNSELCVAMRGGGSVPGSWLTKSCSRTFGVICEVAPAARDNLYNKMEDVTPTGTALTSFPVTTETACVWLCEITRDCLMAVYDGTSGNCSVYNCQSQVTSFLGRRTWMGQ
ncbi:C-type mannose receptor 2-like isoform X1 [Haliotis rufescens]|uniref:C-type mannose receptor 2-like isoform X1 n=1 Tax=Haliotis rufescens TaxID=6454 RepID=UPI00201E886B|nr:C-type mannose receptor 2-like isoform X1 [Haliotis rufescens]XP_048252382.1 C-type mannose receptor 2-like isoform X1 [Haliotis rufescens]